MVLYNTSKILIIVLMCSFIACVNVFVKGNKLLIDLDQRIDFRIEIQDLHAKPILIFKNISKDTIALTLPNCVGRNVWPILIDSAGVDVPGIKIKAVCNYNVFKLLPGNVITEVFTLSMNDWFDIDPDSNYSLYFEYQADVFDKKGNLKISYKILKSKKLGICKGKIINNFETGQ